MFELGKFGEAEAVKEITWRYVRTGVRRLEKGIFGHAVKLIRHKTTTITTLHSFMCREVENKNKMWCLPSVRLLLIIVVRSMMVGTTTIQKTSITTS